MKTLLLALLFLATPLIAADITLEWDDPNPPGDVAKFVVELRTANNVVVATGEPAVTNFDFLALATGRYTARVSAVTAEGLHSDWSDDFVFVVPAKPGKLRIKVSIQTSADLAAWSTVITHEEDMDRRKFYRLKTETTH